MLVLYSWHKYEMTYSNVEVYGGVKGSYFPGNPYCALLFAVATPVDWDRVEDRTEFKK